MNAATIARWRRLAPDDVKSLVRVADKIHPDLSESLEVFQERLRLFPTGCLGLYESDELHGYVISHPIRRHQPPALNTMIGEIAADADQYYIHDLAIMPKLRGYGYAQACMEEILAIARGYSTTSLVSVYGTVPFWTRSGFLHVDVSEVLERKLQVYGPDAVYLERRNERCEGIEKEN